MRPAPLPLPDEDPATVAAHWVERLTAGEPGADDIAALRAWIAADPSHRRAYEQARAIWIELPDTSLRHRRPPLRLVAGTALAVCVALVFALSPGFHDRATATGEITRLSLPDGSTAWLDSDSAIDLAFDERGRTVRLVRGRVAVDVAKEAGRPFAVQAGDATITDVGTVFSVDRVGGLAVSVAQGLVDVARDGRVTRLEAGEAGSFVGPSPRLRPLATGELAWRDGRILLDDVSLSRALAELDRYYSGRIVLLDGDLASRKVSGTLFAGRAEEGIAAVARSEGLSVIRLPWLILIGRAE